jgi:three-Cys-motif partner protein
MQAPRTTIWEMPELTPIKHQLLSDYLEWWFPTMLQKHEQIRFIDGFAGPGEYKGHQPGSPIIAIDALRRSVSTREHMNNVAFWFIDDHERRCGHLYGEIRKLQRSYPIIADLKLPTITRGCFARVLNRYLAQEEKKQTTFLPTLTFIDPFGVSDTPISIIGRLMKYPHNDVLITFMHEGVNRCLTQEEKKTQRHILDLFGTEPHQYIEFEGNRVPQICALYRRQLHVVAKIPYISMLHLQNPQQGADYTLVFGTHCRENLEKMKDIFWKLDPKHGSTYSAPPPNQPYLMPPEPDYASLARELRSVFREKTVRVCELEEYVLAATKFRKKDIEHALWFLVQAAQVKIVSNGNVKNIICAEEDSISFS